MCLARFCGGSNITHPPLANAAAFEMQIKCISVILVSDQCLSSSVAMNTPVNSASSAVSPTNSVKARSNWLDCKNRCAHCWLLHSIVWKIHANMGGDMGATPARSNISSAVVECTPSQSIGNWLPFMYHALANPALTLAASTDPSRRTASSIACHVRSATCLHPLLYAHL